MCEDNASSEIGKLPVCLYSSYKGEEHVGGLSMAIGGYPGLILI